MQKRGIDISYANAGINFDEIQEKYDFVIIRAGFTGWGDGVTSHVDDWFEHYYYEAKKRNLGVGCYFYSCANNSQKGINEAIYLYEHCLKGKQFDYPIFIDVEDSHHQIGYKRGVTDAIISFGDYLEKLGYYVSVYANKDFFRNHIITDEIKRFDKWVAFPDSGALNFEYGQYGMWQNSWNQYVSGIKTDTDIAYYDYPTIIKNKKLNGYGEQIIKDTKYKKGQLVVYSTYYNDRNSINHIDCLQMHGSWLQDYIKDVDANARQQYQLNNGRWINDGDIRELK